LARHAEAFGNPLQPATPPAVTERDGNRDHLRPSSGWYAIEVANEFPKQVIGEQFPNDQLQECARPREIRRASREQPYRTRAQFFAPSLDVESLFGSNGLFEVMVDTDDVTDVAHTQTSTNRGTHAVLWRAEFAEGLGRPRSTVCE